MPASQKEINLTKLTDDAVAKIVALPYRSGQYSYSGPNRLHRARRSVGAIVGKYTATLAAAGWEGSSLFWARKNLWDVAELAVNAEDE